MNKKCAHVFKLDHIQNFPMKKIGLNKLFGGYKIEYSICEKCHKIKIEYGELENENNH